MRAPNAAKSRNRSAGLPRAQLAMWDRLYGQPSLGKLPWARQDPYPPLARAVKDGWIVPPGPILDVGCGLGTNTFWLASRGFRATGIDVASGAIAAASSDPRAQGRNPTFRIDDILDSTLPARRYRAAVDVGCFHTLPPRLRQGFARGLYRVLAPGAPYLLFWVAREETGAWGPPHRLSLGEVADAFEDTFRFQRVEYRPRQGRITRAVMRSSRPLATLAGYSAVLVRREESQPSRR